MRTQFDDLSADQLQAVSDQLLSVSRAKAQCEYWARQVVKATESNTDAQKFYQEVRDKLVKVLDEVLGARK